MDLTPSLHQELETRARRMLRARKLPSDPETLSLVNEAWMKMANADEPTLATRGEQLAYYASVLRSVLLNLARHRSAIRRGGGQKHVHVGDSGVQPGEADVDAQVLDIDEKLDELRNHDADLSRIVELRFFGGLTWGEVSEVMGKSEKAVQADWEFARMWLRGALADGQED